MLGPYEILSLIGAGGMGEVYKARDTRLERIVAIKVLPAHLAERSDLRERFEREARAIANLQHPNICVLHDIGEQELAVEEPGVAPASGQPAEPPGRRRYQVVHYLVMEFLDGETLAQRLMKGPLPLEQVLRYASEISDALDKAHRQGYTHRDIKPGNIMVTKEGSKILDFGLAKFKQEAAQPNLPQSQIPTEPSALTDKGTLLGTLQYMAPEQVEAKEVDARTDIFAFGAVVYEMATGKKAFEGKSQASLIGAILKDDPPPMSFLQPMTPPALDRVVKTCLAKDPDERWQAARDLTKQLKWIAEGGSQAGMPAPVVARRKVRERLGWALAAVAVLVAVALAVTYLGRSPTPPETMRFAISTPGTPDPTGSPSISPDGRRLVFPAPDPSGKQLLWVRLLDSLAAQPLAGTEPVTGSQFWSPDGRFIGFFAEGKLKKVELASGTVQTIADAPSARGGTWNRDGVILFAPEIYTGLARVSAAGGAVTPVTTLDSSRGESSHRFPQFLPDGRHFLYLALTAERENRAIYIGSLDSKETRRLLSTNRGAAYASPGYLLFMSEESLMAQPFDAERLELTGEPVLVAEGVLSARSSGVANFFVSESGVLAYTNAAVSNTQLVWFDRSGQKLNAIGRPEQYSGTPELSPDGKRIAVARGAPGTEDLWLWDLAGGPPRDSPLIRRGTTPRTGRPTGAASSSAPTESPGATTCIRRIPAAPGTRSCSLRPAATTF